MYQAKYQMEKKLKSENKVLNIVSFPKAVIVHVGTQYTRIHYTPRHPKQRPQSRCKEQLLPQKNRAEHELIFLGEKNFKT